MHCKDCQHWFRGTSRQYKNNARIFLPSAEEGKAVCRSGGAIDGQVVPSTFGCVDFNPCEGEFDQIDFLKYDQEPWQVWEMIPCPDCRGEGSSNDSACHRCAGTANVRKYADGFIGDERTREHPVEKEIRLEKQRQDLMARMRAELEELEKTPAPVEPELASEKGRLDRGGLPL